MKHSNIIYNVYRRCGLIGTFVFTLTVLLSSSVFGMTQVGLYDVWEIKVTNSKTYSNPFDYTVIELQATFTSPSGNTFNFYGFYDGNGNGGQTGNLWKLRFMPDKVGTWTYTYSWTDGTSGGSGSFNVNDTGLPGPLKVATDNPWYFQDSRGKPFHFRGYGINHTDRHSPSNSYINDLGWLKNIIQNEMINKGYNFTMSQGLSDRKRRYPGVTYKESWWLNTSDLKTFNVAAFRAYEDVLHLTKNNGIYFSDFAGMIFQHANYGFTDFKVFLRYWVARFAPFSNHLGWSPSWEWTDIWSASQVNQIMNQAQGWDPFSRLLSVHDCSDNGFSAWLDFSMRQRSSRTVFKGNGRQVGQNQGACNASGGVANRFKDKPIIGSEDIWEIPSGQWGQPRNRDEVRRGAWGIQMAGVLPLYSEWNPFNGGNGTAEPDIRRMFDFFYSQTKYREYTQLNQLVSSSARQIASGKDGVEYLVYDENGGSITINLSGAQSSNTFTALWYNPTSGATQNGNSVNGGGSRTLPSPFSGDSVLLLKSAGADNEPPIAPTGLSVVPIP